MEALVYRQKNTLDDFGIRKAKTGVTVIATASKPKSQNWVKKLGVDIIVNHR